MNSKHDLKTVFYSKSTKITLEFYDTSLTVCRTKFYKTRKFSTDIRWRGWRCGGRRRRWQVGSERSGESCWWREEEHWGRGKAGEQGLLIILFMVFNFLNYLFHCNFEICCGKLHQPFGKLCIMFVKD